jgi:hypothetical protein
LQAVALAIFACSGVLCPASAQAAEPETRPLEGAERHRVLLGLAGELGASERDALSALLEPELERAGLKLAVEPVNQPISAFAERGRRDPSLLLLAVLDARRADHIELYIVDAERGRAVVRRLPGGLAANSAALEAVASILLSATDALSEGLEVASLPVESVMPATTSPEGARRPSPQSGESALGPAPHGPVRLSLGAGVAVATFGDSAPLSAGATAWLAATLPSKFTFRLSGAAFLPTDFETDVGDFSLRRFELGASANYWLGTGPLFVAPELGLIQEFFRRSATSPAAGVNASDAAWSYRTGALAGARARYCVARELCLVLSAASAFFPSRVRIVAAVPEALELAAPSRWVLLGRAGAELSW